MLAVAIPTALARTGSRIELGGRGRRSSDHFHHEPRTDHIEFGEIYAMGCKPLIILVS